MAWLNSNSVLSINKLLFVILLQYVSLIHATYHESCGDSIVSSENLSAKDFNSFYGNKNYQVVFLGAKSELNSSVLVKYAKEILDSSFEKMESLGFHMKGTAPIGVLVEVSPGGIYTGLYRDEARSVNIEYLNTYTQQNGPGIYFQEKLDNSRTFVLKDIFENQPNYFSLVSYAKDIFTEDVRHLLILPVWKVKYKSYITLDEFTIGHELSHLDLWSSKAVLYEYKLWEEARSDLIGYFVSGNTGASGFEINNQKAINESSVLFKFRSLLNPKVKSFEDLTFSTLNGAHANSELISSTLYESMSLTSEQFIIDFIHYVDDLMGNSAFPMLRFLSEDYGDLHLYKPESYQVVKKSHTEEDHKRFVTRQVSDIVNLFYQYLLEGKSKDIISDIQFNEIILLLKEKKIFELIKL